MPTGGRGDAAGNLCAETGLGYAQGDPHLPESAIPQAKQGPAIELGRGRMYYYRRFLMQRLTRKMKTAVYPINRHA